MNIKKIVLFSTIFLMLLISSIALKDSISSDIDLNVTKSRAEIVEIATAHSKQLGFEDCKYLYDIYNDNSYLQYAKIEHSEGSKIINENISKGFYPSYWSLSSKDKSLRLYISFSGRVLGYSIKYPEDKRIKSISKGRASKLAYSALSNYVDSSIFKRSGYSYLKRVGYSEHTFTYESSSRVKDATLQYIVVVSGNRVSALYSEINVPLTFLSKFLAARSKNLLIYLLGWVVHILLAVVMLGAFIYYLYRDRVSLLFSVKIASIFFVLYLITTLSNLPNGFLTSLNYIFSTMLTNIIFSLFIIILVSTAISVDEDAFPKHLSFRAIFNPNLLASSEYIDLVMRGYFIGSILLFMAVIFNTIAYHLGGIFGLLINTSMFLVKAPYLSAFTSSIQAGVLEEMFFRTLTVGGVVIISRKYKWRALLPLVLIVQALQFGAAHAMYPSMPSFLRVVESIVPSIFIFSLSYWRFGLFTGVVVHFVYNYLINLVNLINNIVLYSYMDLVIFTLLGLMPILLHIYFRYIAKFAAIPIFNSDMKIDSFKKISSIRREAIPLSALILSVMFISMWRINRHRVERVDIDKMRSQTISILSDMGVDFDESDLYVDSRAEESIKKISEDKREDVEFKYSFHLNDRERKNSISILFNRLGRLTGYRSKLTSFNSNRNLSRDRAISLAKERVKMLFDLSDFEVREVVKSRERLVNWSFRFSSSSMKIDVKVIGDRVVSIMPSYIKSSSSSLIYQSTIRLIAKVIFYLLLVILIVIGLTKLSPLKMTWVPIIYFITKLVNEINLWEITYRSIPIYESRVYHLFKYIFIFLFSSSKEVLILFSIILLLNNFRVKERDLRVKISAALVIALGFASLNAIYFNKTIVFVKGYLPELSIVYGYIDSYLRDTTMIVAGVVLANYLNSLPIAFIIFIVVGFIKCSIVLSTISYYIVFAILFGLICFVAYIFGASEDPSAIFLGLFIERAISLIPLIFNIPIAIFAWFAVALYLVYELSFKNIYD